MKFASSLLCLALPWLTRAQGPVQFDDEADGGGAPTYQPGSGLTNWVGQPDQNPPQPHLDPFYTQPPTDLSKYANGAIINKRPISLSGLYSGISDALQVSYRTEDAHGTPAMSVAIILKPSQPAQRKPGTVPVVLYELAEDAIYLDCAPTYQVFNHASSEVQALLSNGFVVVIPDYEGQRGSYTVGKLAGKHILDSARAVNLIPTIRNQNESTSFGIWGYGTGGFAAAWAGELANTYAPELAISAVAFGGAPTNLLNWARSINASPYSSLLVSSLLGMATEYKDVSDILSSTIQPHRRNQFEAAATRCNPQNTFHYFGLNVTTQYFTPGVDPLGSKKVQSVYDLNSLGQSIPKATVYAYQSTDDEMASNGDIHQLLHKYCQQGVSVKFRQMQGLNHYQTEAQYDDVIDFLVTTMSGIPILNSCPTLDNSNN